MEEKSNADKWRDRIRTRQAQDRQEGTARPQAGPVPDVTMLTVKSVPRAVLTDLQALAFRCGSSPSALGLLAIEQMLAKARTGTVSLPPKPGRQVN